MLRRCRLCARHVELSSLPIASTSSYVFSTAGQTQDGSRRTRKHDRFNKRHFTSSYTSLQLEATADSASLRWTEEGTSKSYWKGKAREVDVPRQQQVPTAALPTRPTAFSVNRQTSAPSSTRLVDECVKVSPTRAAPAESDALESSKEYATSLKTAVDDSKAVLKLVDEAISRLSVSDEQARLVLQEQIQKYPSPNPTIANIRSAVKHPQESYTLQLVFEQTLSTICQQKIWHKVHTHFVSSLRKLVDANPPYLADTLENLASFLSSQRKWTILVSIFHDLRSSLPFWTPLCVQYLIQAIIHTGHYNRTPPIASFPPSLLSKLTDTTYNLFLKAHLANRDLYAARAVLQAMVRYGHEPTQETYLHIFQGYRSLGHNETLYQTIFSEDAGMGLLPSTNVLNSFIEMHIATGDLPAALDVFQLFNHETTNTKLAQLLEASETSLPPVTDITAALGEGAEQSDLVSTGNGNPIAPLPVSGLSSLGLQPNADTFALFVKGYSKLGKLEQALDFYTEMMDQGYMPSHFLSQSIIKAYSSVNNTTEARKLISRVERLRSTVDAASTEDGLYRAILPSVLQTEGISGLQALIQEMREKDIVVSNKFVAIVLHYLAKSGTIGAIPLARLAHQIRTSTKALPTISEFNTILNAFVRREEATRSLKPKSVTTALPSIAPTFDARPRRLDSFLSLVQQLYDENITTDAHTIAILMRRFANNHGQPSLLWAYFRWQILDRGLQPREHHIAALMTAYVKVNDLYGARQAMDRGQALGVCSNVQLYTILISAFLDRRNKIAADRLYSEMLEKGIQPDLHLYASFAKWFASRGRVDLVEEIHSRVKEQSVGKAWPNNAMETILFQARQIRKEPSQAYAGLALALRSGLEPDKTLAHAVKTAIAQNRRFYRDRMKVGEDTSSIERTLVSAGEVLDLVAKKRRDQRQREKDASAKGIQTIVKSVLDAHVTSDIGRL